jgi:hypothetical protein
LTRVTGANRVHAKLGSIVQQAQAKVGDETI